MKTGRAHLLAAAWAADVALLPLLIPENANGSSLLIALTLWTPPTLALAFVTWWWLHDHRGVR